MSRAPIDLFDGSPWSGEAPADEVPRVSPRPCLFASLALVALLLFSMQYPWLTGGVTTATGQTSPFSTLLSRGWFPGTRNWGFLMLGLGILTALAIVIGILWERAVWLKSLLVVTTILAIVTLTEAFAPSVLNLHADYGAWIGVPAVVFAWCCITIATALAVYRRPARSGLPVRATASPRRAILCVSALVVVGLGVGLGLALTEGPSGDSGGVILHEMESSLSPMSAILPADASEVKIQSIDAIWHGSCDDLSSKPAGWTKVRVNVSFTSAGTTAVVRDAVGQGLETHGWTTAGPTRWTKDLQIGTVTSASLYTSSMRTGVWRLSVTAKPPGYAPSGC